MLKRSLFLMGYFFSMQIHAFPCFITLVKDNCWTNYDLTVDITNAMTGKVLMSLVVPQGQSWVRQTFTCQPKDRLSLKARFTPAIWTTDADKSYPAKQDLVFPDVIKTGDTAWNVNVCYSDAFKDIPLPPESNGQCQCNMDKIPAIQPQ